MKSDFTNKTLAIQIQGKCVLRNYTKGYNGIIITRNVKHIVFFSTEEDSPQTASHVSLLSLILVYSVVRYLLFVLETFVCRNLNGL